MFRDRTYQRAEAPPIYTVALTSGSDRGGAAIPTKSRPAETASSKPLELAPRRSAPRPPWKTLSPGTEPAVQLGEDCDVPRRHHGRAGRGIRFHDEGSLRGIGSEVRATADASHLESVFWRRQPAMGVISQHVCAIASLRAHDRSVSLLVNLRFLQGPRVGIPARCGS